MSDKRARVRRRVFKAGKITFDHAATIDCTIVNISETGACLKVESPVGIPERFALHLVTDRTTRECLTVWRKAARIGVTFTAGPQRVDHWPTAYGPTR